MRGSVGWQVVAKPPQGHYLPHGLARWHNRDDSHAEWSSRICVTSRRTLDIKLAKSFAKILPRKCCCSRVGSGGICRCSWAEFSNFGPLTCQYPALCCLSIDILNMIYILFMLCGQYLSIGDWISNWPRRQWKSRNAMRNGRTS